MAFHRCRGKRPRKMLAPQNAVLVWWLVKDELFSGLCQVRSGLEWWTEERWPPSIYLTRLYYPRSVKKEPGVFLSLGRTFRELDYDSKHMDSILSEPQFPHLWNGAYPFSPEGPSNSEIHKPKAPSGIRTPTENKVFRRARESQNISLNIILEMETHVHTQNLDTNFQRDNPNVCQ